MPAPKASSARKRLLRRLLALAELDVRRRRNVPFGVRWEDDIRYFLGGRPLRVALDVGAHTGETSDVLLHAFPGVSVHAFEPSPDNFAELRRAVSGDDVRTVNAAVSDRSGTVRFAAGDTSFRGRVEGPGPAIEVPAVTIDEYVRSAGIDHVDLLKIDTEGHEEAVLRGASALLDRDGPEFVVCECDFTHRPDEPHGDFREIFALLEPRGYRVVAFYSGGVDNLGWLWGDVLFRRATGERDNRWASRSPYVSRRDGA